jgi:hypothetical protein
MGDQKRSNKQVHARPRGLFQEFECLAALKDPPDLLLFLVLGLTLPSGDSGFAKLSWLERAANILNKRRCQIVIILLAVTAPRAAFLRLGPAPRSALSGLLCCAHNNTATPVPVRGKERPRRGGCRWKPTPWQWCEAERAGASHGISPVTSARALVTRTNGARPVTSRSCYFRCFSTTQIDQQRKATETCGTGVVAR